MAVELNYPKETSSYNSRLVFRKYERPRPNSPVTSTTEATIRLPLPTNLSDQFNMQISDVQFDILGNFGSASDIATSGKTKLEQYASEIRGGRGAISFIKDASLGVAALMPGISDTKLGALAKTELGIIRNPHHTTLFDGVRLKTYSFTWKMSPKSQDEANTLEEIVKNIKGYMHPAISAAGFALDYPSLAELTFEVGENKLVPNVKPSFITSFTINGSAGGTPAFYRDGKSTIVEMSIAFQEINVQTREDFLGRPDTTG
jgi:hypothetical protein